MILELFPTTVYLDKNEDIISVGLRKFISFDLALIPL